MKHDLSQYVEDQERLDEAQAAALEFVNGVLSERGFPKVEALHPGIPGDTRACAVAATLRIGSGGAISPRTKHSDTIVYQSVGTVGFGTYEHDAMTAEFSAYFDAGLYPELIVDA